MNDAKGNGRTSATGRTIRTMLSVACVEIPGFVKTDDHGTLERQLLFQPA